MAAGEIPRLYPLRVAVDVCGNPQRACCGDDVIAEQELRYVLVSLERIEERVNVRGAEGRLAQVHSSVRVDDAALELIERSAPDLRASLCAIELGVVEQETASVATMAEEAEHGVKDVRFRYDDWHG